MHLTSETVDALVDQLSRLPTVGRKTAQRGKHRERQCSQRGSATQRIDELLA